MGVGGRLRSLDDRVLGRPRPAAAPAYRRDFLVGAGSSLAVLAAIVLSGQGGLLAAVGGFLGLAIGTGVRWWRADLPGRRSARVTVVAGGSLVAAACALTFATHDRWAEQQSVFPSDARTPEPTMVVQCAETAQGRAYIYQPPVSVTPRCENGAVPQVVLRP